MKRTNNRKPLYLTNFSWILLRSILRASAYFSIKQIQRIFSLIKFPIDWLFTVIITIDFSLVIDFSRLVVDYDFL